MRDLSKLVSNENILRSIADLFTPKTYLVGGCLRDMLLGQKPRDFDIVTFGDISNMAESIGKRLSSSAFWMDKKRGVVRIFLKQSGVTIDICSPKGRDIHEDLLKRDITINAIGFDMETRELIDPFNGIEDLENGIIRIISEENLRDDPARVIRCLRFSVMLGFAIASSTMSLLKIYSPLIREVSPERIKQEFMKALCYINGSRFFYLMETASLTEILFTSVPQQQDFLGVCPALRMASEMDGLIYEAPGFMRGIGNILEQEMESGLSRSGMLRLAVFLFGMYGQAGTERSKKGVISQYRRPSYSAPHAREFCLGFRFSSHAVSFIQGTISCQELVHDLLSKQDPSAIDLYFLCDAAGPFLPEALLLALANKKLQAYDLSSGIDLARDKELISRVWHYYNETYLEYKRTPLINGSDVIRQLGLEPGPEVGQYLRSIETARSQGEVNTRQEALDYLLTLKP